MRIVTEEWRRVPGWDDLYEVSSIGRLRSFDKIVVRKNGTPLPIRGRRLRTSLNANGYPQTVLTKDGARTTIAVHVLVAAAFIGPRPDGAEICHFDDVKTHNDVSNLRYGTTSQNAFDRVRNGVHNQARKTECPKGHLYDVINTYRPQGNSRVRFCLRCHREAARAGMRAMRAARRDAGLVSLGNDEIDPDGGEA
jgi:hypothetical protein